VYYAFNSQQDKVVKLVSFDNLWFIEFWAVSHDSLYAIPHA